MDMEEKEQTWCCYDIPGRYSGICHTCLQLFFQVALRLDQACKNKKSSVLKYSDAKAKYFV